MPSSPLAFAPGKSYVADVRGALLSWDGATIKCAFGCVNTAQVGSKRQAVQWQADHCAIHHDGMAWDLEVTLRLKLTDYSLGKRTVS